ncbi:hypothetical protein X801_07135, partial [Opisthorchis viverrini]
MDTMLSTLQQAVNMVPPGTCESPLQWLDSIRPTWERVRTDVLSEPQVCCQNTQHALADILSGVEDRVDLATQLLPIDSEFGQDRLQQAYRHLELACWLYEKQMNLVKLDVLEAQLDNLLSAVNSTAKKRQPDQTPQARNFSERLSSKQIQLIRHILFNRLHYHEFLVSAPVRRHQRLNYSLLQVDNCLDLVVHQLRRFLDVRQPEHPSATYALLLRLPNDACIAQLPPQLTFLDQYCEEVRSCISEKPITYPLHLRELGRVEQYPEDDGTSAYVADLMRQIASSLLDRAQIGEYAKGLRDWSEKLHDLVRALSDHVRELVDTQKQLRSALPNLTGLHLGELAEAVAILEVRADADRSGQSGLHSTTQGLLAQHIKNAGRRLMELETGLEHSSECTRVLLLLSQGAKHWKKPSLEDRRVSLREDYEHSFVCQQLRSAWSRLAQLGDRLGRIQAGLPARSFLNESIGTSFNGATDVKSIPDVRSPAQFSKTSFEPSSRLNAEELRRKRLNLRDLLGSHSCVYPECKRAREEWATCRTVVSKEQLSMDAQVRQVFIELVHFYARLRKDLIEHREPAGIEDTRSSHSAIRVKWHCNTSMTECYENLMERVRQLSACELPQVVKLRAKAKSLEQLWVGPRGESSQLELKRLGSGSENGRDVLDHDFVKSLNGRSSVSSTESSSDIHIHLGDHLEGERLLNGTHSTRTTATLHLAQADRSEQAIDFTQAPISVRRLACPAQLASASIGAEDSMFSVIGDVSEASSNLSVSGLNNPVDDGERMQEKNHSAWVTEPSHHLAVHNGSSKTTEKHLAKQDQAMEMDQPFASVRKSDESRVKTSFLSVEHKEFTFSVDIKYATGESVLDSSNPSGEHHAECMLNGDRSAQIAEAPHSEEAGVVALGKTSEDTDDGQKSAPLWGFDGLKSGSGFRSVCNELPTLPADTKMALSPSDDQFGIQRLLSGNRSQSQLKRDKDKPIYRTPEQRSEQEQETGVDQNPAPFGIADDLKSPPALSPVDLKENVDPVKVNISGAPGDEKSPAVDTPTSLLNAARQAQLMKSYLTKHRRDKRRHRKQQKNSENTVAFIGTTENRQNGHATTERGRVDSQQTVSVHDRPQVKPFVSTEVHIELLTQTPPGTYEVSRIASRTNSSASEEAGSNPLPDEELNHLDESSQIHPAVSASSPFSNLMVPEVRNGLEHSTKQSHQPLRSLFPQPLASSTPSYPASDLLPAPVNGLGMRPALQPTAVQSSNENGVAEESRTPEKETDKDLIRSGNGMPIKQSTVPTVVMDGMPTTRAQITHHARRTQTDTPLPITQENSQSINTETKEDYGRNDTEWITVQRDIHRKRTKSKKTRAKTPKKASKIQPEKFKNDDAETKPRLAGQTIIPLNTQLAAGKGETKEAQKQPNSPNTKGISEGTTYTQEKHPQQHIKQTMEKFNQLQKTVVCPTEHDAMLRSERSAVLTDAVGPEQESWLVA